MILLQLNAIPTVGGPSAPLLSYIAAFNFMKDGKDLLVQGYQKVRCCRFEGYLYVMLTRMMQYRGSAFKVALLDQWMVIVSGSKMVDELRKRPDEELSFIEGVEEVRRRVLQMCSYKILYPHHRTTAHANAVHAGTGAAR